MHIIKRIRGSPFVGEVALYLATFTRKQETVKDQDFQNISLEKVGVGTVLPTDLEIHDRIIGIPIEIDLGCIGLIISNHHIKCTRTDQTGGYHTLLFLCTTRYHKYIHRTPHITQGSGGEEVIIYPVKTHGTTATNLIRFIGRTGG